MRRAASTRSRIRSGSPPTRRSRASSRASASSTRCATPSCRTWCGCGSTTASACARPRAARSFPPNALRLIGALTEARLLTTRSSDAGREPLVEVTHEALFKAWPALDRWLTEEQAFLTDLERIRAAHENYAKAPDEQKSGELLYGLLLSRARDWLLKYPQRFISREMEPLRAFIAASAEVADAERARERRSGDRLRGMAAASCCREPRCYLAQYRTPSDPGAADAR